MTSKRIELTAAAALAFLAASPMLLGGCTGKSMRRLDPGRDDDLGGTLIDSSDVVEITNRASDAVSKVLLASPRNDLVVAFPKLKNESRQDFPSSMFQDPIRDRVLLACAPRVKFLAREDLDDITKEREGKRTGVYSGDERKHLLGANFLLTGTIKSLTKQSEGDVADYFQISFRLVDAEDSGIVWSNTYQFKKAGDSGVIYR